MVDEESLVKWFSYRTLSEEDQQRCDEVRRAGLSFASVIVAYCPPCADQSAAIRKVREAVMTANMAISYEEKKARVLEDG